MPAIYFVSPTQANIRRIAQDLSKSLYASSYVNFTSALSRALLEEFAETVARDGSVEGVEQVYDQHLDFLVLSANLFSLHPSLVTPMGPAIIALTAVADAAADFKTTYEKLNAPSAGEAEIEEVTDRVARGLFSVLVTMGQLPIIRAPRGNAAEMVARKVDARLRDHLASSRGSNAFSASGTAADGSFGRPRRLTRRRAPVQVKSVLLMAWPVLQCS